MKKGQTASMAMGIAFVGFITQFGGGFASGAQIYQYFINYGVFALITPIIAQAIMALVYYYGMQYAYDHQTYDYRHFSNAFYGKFKGVFSNLYDIEYIVMVCLAPAVAFATGASVLNQLLGLPYLLCTFMIGVVIFLVTIFGTDVVRRCSSVLSIVVIVGLMVVLIPNIIVQRELIITAIQKMMSGQMPVTAVGEGGIVSAVKRGAIYGIFQLTAIGLMYQHVKGVHSKKEIKKSMVYMFVINTVVMELTIIGLLAVAYLPELAGVDVPMLLMVQKGVGAIFLTPLISILMILGAVSTGVTMIAGIVERTVKQFEKKRPMKRVHYIIASLCFTLLAFAISQFGLIPLVGRGYSYIGYATIFVIVIPFMLHFLYRTFRRESLQYETK